MTLWSDDRGLDAFVRASDRTLNVLVIVLLAAFALGSGAYYYGQMNPRVASAVSDSASPAQQAPSQPN